MATYIIGDLQGCFDEFQTLLQLIAFNPTDDQLCFVGDLVNRGPRSLDVLRFIYHLKNPLIVLGNHDLHLLAVGYGVLSEKPGDTLSEILNSPEKMDLLEWLRHQPLTLFNSHLNFFLVHAGFPPQWNVNQILNNAEEVSEVLRGPNFLDFLKHMRGNLPNEWNENLTGFERWRYIINAFTRIRFCDANGRLDLENKTAQSADTIHYKPWFDWKSIRQDIVFGHWAALEGKCDVPGVYALDTGCVWGGRLTAIRVEDKKLFSVVSKQPKKLED